MRPPGSTAPASGRCSATSRCRLLKPFVIIISLLTIEDTFRAFDLMQTMTAGGPFFSTEIIEIYIYRWAFAAPIPQLGHASAAAVLFGAFVFVGRPHSALGGLRRAPDRGRTTPHEWLANGDPPGAGTAMAAKALRRLPWWIAVAFLVGVAILWIYPFVWMRLGLAQRQHARSSPRASS